ncbi:response regulator transcription factor [Clostridium estertheticum]|uniref:response regulator transcription factor n=1 Tax=Clostridium estertheticum TaxID=238834 RepID=UPI0013E92472|nr:response regulator transcription factor [Clostridium estertheticum]MBZ9689507.1 response regulator transcription factor [Clostridium estertheticum]
MEKTILVVEDDDRLRKLISDYLKIEDFKVIQATNGKEALLEFQNEKIDLIILDVMMPILDGFTVCKTIRANSDVPIIFLTSKSEDEDKLKGFELGADEYVTKPFSPKVLVARTISLLKRIEGTIGSSGNVIDMAGLKVNLLSRQVHVDNKEINLSPTEYDLLAFLIKNKGIVLSRNALLDNVWGYSYDGDIRTVDTHIKRLREKLNYKSKFICTVRGTGYRFEVIK